MRDSKGSFETIFPLENMKPASRSQFLINFKRCKEKCTAPLQDNADEIFVRIRSMDTKNEQDVFLQSMIDSRDCEQHRSRKQVKAQDQHMRNPERYLSPSDVLSRNASFVVELKVNHKMLYTSGCQHSLKCAKGKRSRPVCPVVQQEEVESIPASSYECTIGALCSPRNSPDRLALNHIDHILIDKRRDTSRPIVDIQGGHSDHYLAIVKLREKLSVAKRVEQQINIRRFNIPKFKDEETKQNYQLDISNRFATLESPDEVEKELDVNSVWENIRDRIKIAAEQSIGYSETKKKKPWFDED
ncbi:hypothetical protein ANN_26863 [Periplaneta americana]|uniref:Uncharacterized protein n=1 Tax=Periplaneta americana TaxID=6978 RepID=A0ABQ8RZA0_PERAM|nr:hypothetical protein ANN_26863 [Periplaneta americana]